MHSGKVHVFLHQVASWTIQLQCQNVLWFPATRTQPSWFFENLQEHPFTSAHQNSLPRTMDGLAPERKGWLEVWKRFPFEVTFLGAFGLFLFFGWRSSWFNLIPRNLLGRSLYTNIQFNKITGFLDRVNGSRSGDTGFLTPNKHTHHPCHNCKSFAPCWSFIPYP